jgi:quinol monooxygenase YgiN
VELYADQAALKVHSTTPHFKEFFGKFSAVMAGAPEIMILEEVASK